MDTPFPTVLLTALAAAALLALGAPAAAQPDALPTDEDRDRRPLLEVALEDLDETPLADHLRGPTPSETRSEPSHRGPGDLPGSAPCVPHPSIEVTEDHGPDGFNWTNPVTGADEHRPGSGVVAGNGTAGNPYVIAGWCIAPQAEGTGILLRDTTAHVIIRDNLVDGRNPVLSDQHVGIHLDEARNVTLRGNDVVHNVREGIRVAGPDGTTIRGNTVSANHGDGIDLDSANRTVLRVNTIAGNDLNGIVVTDSPGLTLVGNTVARNFQVGVRVSDSPDVTASSNLFEDNLAGMDLRASDGADLRDNAFERHLIAVALVYSQDATLRDNDLGSGGVETFGLGLPYHEHDIDASNTVNGEPLRYVREETGVTVAPPAGQVLVVNSTDVRVDDVDISMVSTGVQVAHASGTTLTDVDVSRSSVGVDALFSEGTTVADGNVSGNWFDGIRLDQTTNATVRQNEVHGNDRGVSLVFDSNATVRRNDIVGNRDGVHIRDSEALVHENALHENTDDGVHVELDTFLIEDEPAIHGNNIRGNGDAGVEVAGGEDPVDVSRNWWGHASGPSGGTNDACTGETADGQGDEVQAVPGFFDPGHVCFDPWRTSPNPDAGATG